MAEEEEVKIQKDVRVAKVIGPKQLVLSAGYQDGVEIGDKFIILEIGEEVFDPVSGESLGSYEIVKGKGKVFHVTEKLCLVDPVQYRVGGLLSVQSFLASGEHEVKSDPFQDPKVGDIARFYT